jgi:Tol biopolymer transport system component/tRNA A-37 threonylcarbamoyl transferase component Bud32
MGEVWKARDPRLGRDVAIKTSQQRFSDRFQREAYALSKLNHPHICQIYDVGPDYLVMELIEGSPLRGPLPIRTALGYAEQICSALDAAHSAGIVHRDLKPDNILITRHGVKLLDFGLAKTERAVASDTDGSALTATMTGTTEIVGTLYYMSPEQLQGQVVDSRSDIFSVGAVLHEIIAGQRAFAGDSPASVVAAILTGEPRAIAELQPKAPARLSRVLAVCLAKDPEDRWQSARDLQRELGWLRDAPAAAAESPRRSRWKQAAIAAAVLIAIATGAWFLGRARLSDLPEWKVTPLTAYAGNEEMPSISPDGNQVAFVWNGEHQDNQDIYVKQIGDDAPPLRMTRDEAVHIAPCWSPDGKRLAFLRSRAAGVDLIVSSSLGGGERILASSSYLPGFVNSTISWSPDGKFIAMPDGSGIVRVNVDTREARPLTSPPPSGSYDMMPAYAPGGAALAFTQGPDLVTREIWIQKLDARGDPSGKPTRLLEDAESYIGLAWLPQRGSILTSRGFPGSLMESLLQPLGAGPSRILPLDSIAVWYPSYNAKRRRLIYQRRWMDFDIFHFSLDKPDTAPVPVIASTHMDYSFDISPDGKRLVFTSTRTGNPGIWRADTDGTNQILLVTSERGTLGSPRWSPDGKWIVYDVAAGTAGIYAVSADGGSSRQITTTILKDTRPAVSPDGKWLYFTSKESGHSEIWRQRWTGGTRTQITHGGGENGMPSQDGKWIYYSRDGDLWQVPAEGGQETKLLNGITRGYATVAGDSVFYLGGEGERSSVFEYHLSTGQSQVVYRSPFAFEPTYPNSAIGVSLATREVFVTHRVRLESDLVLVDNFR